MKKILAMLTICTIVSVAANAQTEKSTWLLGGGLSFQSTSGSSIFVASPNIGYFVSNNIAVGGEFNIITTSGSTRWSLGPYLRGYLNPTASGSLFGQAGVGFGGGTGGSSTTTFMGKVGYAAFLNKSTALEFSAGLNAGGGSSVFLLGVGFQIHLKK